MIKEITLQSLVEKIDRNLSPVSILSNNRREEYVCARACLANVLYREYNVGKSTLGRVLNRNHSTVINMIENHEVYAKSFGSYNNMYKLFKTGVEMNINEEMLATQRLMEMQDKSKMYDKMIMAIRVGKQSNNINQMFDVLNKLEEEATNYGI